MKILITGASTGIGRQLSLDYAKSQHEVYVAARSIEKLNSLKSNFPKNIFPVVMDVTDKQSINIALKDLGDFDLAILNAGTCEYVDIDKFDSELFERVFQVNFFGVIYCIECLIDKIKAGGQLAITGSLSRQLPFTRAEAYGSSKAAIHYLTKSLAVDSQEKWNFSVHSISPGFVKTPLTDKNDFEMPFIISTEEASKIIIDGLKRKHSDISFPKKLSWPLKFCALLPEQLQHYISVKLRSSS
ncbi:MAG: SDR family NAD(P)-dependent oxidoreductase [Bdellovibrionales bacterium]|nr:SDR family NAD(P)-dependent oxidoreductase [Bdellovibrionales bacterium]